MPQVSMSRSIWPETPHVFQVTPFLPESGRAIEHIVDFVSQRTGWQASPGR
jgi:hypothetical protein